MTTVQEQPEQGTLNDPVELRFTPQGAPLAVRWDGRLWPVAAEPLYWNNRRNRWEPAVPTGPKRGQPDDIEYWRLQVRAMSSAPLRTLEVRRHPCREGWHLTRVCDERP
ncbi:hypothetical protein AAIH25_20920 [Arthrobacter crystallopoietes]|uniref:hypothetical protein n=1 Tax=Crystallibacter crystallopoietes TaxID=37928 RepID=UPI003D2002D6